MEERLLLWFYVISACYLSLVFFRRARTRSWYPVVAALIGLVSAAGLAFPGLAGPAFVAGTAGVLLFFVLPGVLVRIGRRAAAGGRFGRARRWTGAAVALVPAEGLRQEQELYAAMDDAGGDHPLAEKIHARLGAAAAGPPLPGRASVALVALIVTVHATATLLGDTQSHLTLLELGANYGPLVRAGELHRLVTAVFLHIGHLHLVVNVLAIWVLGRWVEPSLGWARTLVLFLLSGVAGNLASFFLYAGAENPVISAGASGGAMGMVGAATALLLSRRRGPREAQQLSSLFLVIGATFFLGVVEDMIDNGAHLGGLAAGFLLSLFFTRVSRLPETVARAAAGALAAVTLLAFVWVGGSLPRWRELVSFESESYELSHPSFYSPMPDGSFGDPASGRRSPLGSFTVEIVDGTGLDREEKPPEEEWIEDPASRRVAVIRFLLPEGDTVLRERVVGPVTESFRFLGR